MSDVRFNKTAKDTLLLEGKIYIPQASWAKFKNDVEKLMSGTIAKKTIDEFRAYARVVAAKNGVSLFSSQHSFSHYVRVFQDFLLNLRATTRTILLPTSLGIWAFDNFPKQVIDVFFNDRSCRWRTTATDKFMAFGENDPQTTRYALGPWEIILDENYHTVYVKMYDVEIAKYAYTPSEACRQCFRSLARDVNEYHLWPFIELLSKVKYFGKTGGLIRLHYDNMPPVVFGSGENALPLLRKATRRDTPVKSDPRLFV